MEIKSRPRYAEFSPHVVEGLDIRCNVRLRRKDAVSLVLRLPCSVGEFLQTALRAEFSVRFPEIRFANPPGGEVQVDEGWNTFWHTTDNRVLLTVEDSVDGVEWMFQNDEEDETRTDRLFREIETTAAAKILATLQPTLVELLFRSLEDPIVALKAVEPCGLSHPHTLWWMEERRLRRERWQRQAALNLATHGSGNLWDLRDGW